MRTLISFFIILFLSLCNTKTNIESGTNLPKFKFSQPNCTEKSRYFVRIDNKPLYFNKWRNYSIDIDKSKPYYIEKTCRKRYFNLKILLKEEVVFKIENNDTTEVYQKKEYSKFIDLYNDEYLRYDFFCSDKIETSKAPYTYCWKYSKKHESEWPENRNRLSLDSVRKENINIDATCGVDELYYLEKDFPTEYPSTITKIQVDSILESWDIY